jgi:predicted dehydrogenase
MEKTSPNNSNSRRDFIRNTAIAASAFTIIPRYVMGGKGYTAPSDKLNIACVGLGGKGRVDIDGVKSENIIALCDVDQVQASMVKNNMFTDLSKNAYDAFPKARHYVDFREMLEKEKDIDAVTVSTPDHTHAIITMTAMKMGKHVYTQKPITRTVEESMKIVEFAKKSGVATQMGNQGHANPGPRILNELIWQAAIGKVTEVHIWTDRPIWPQGIAKRPTQLLPVPSTLDWNLWLGPSPDRPYHSDYLPMKWRGWWDFGCGALGDMGCHLFDYPFWALKLTAPLTIEAYSSPVFEETAPIASMITYTFKSGLDGSLVNVIWYDGGLKPSMPEGLVTESALWKKGSGLVFKGDRGTIVYGHHQPKPVLLVNGKEQDYGTPKEMIPRSPGHYQEWINECKGSKDRAMSNFDYAGPLNEAVLLGNVAVRSKQKLVWDAEKKMVSNVPEANKFLRAECRSGWEL